ncbi:MAG TPA: hypothetical protein VLI93_00255 [Acetobacteraceae bacterium]|nr:hypothetical protein [Acetobacteraceae bacterium]
MYLARFSYHLRPSDRERAIEFIHGEMKAARDRGLNGRLLIPLTRGPDGAALQFEVELKQLDQLDQFRQRGMGDKTGDWMHGFSEILTAPPEVEILRLDQ